MIFEQNNILVDNLTLLLLKYQNYMKHLLGMKKVTLDQRKVKKIGFNYKVFVISGTLYINIILRYLIGSYYKDHFPSFPFGFMILFYFSREFGIWTYFIISFYGSICQSEVYKTAIIKLSRVIKQLEADGLNSCRRFRNRFIFMHFMIVFTRILYFYYETFSRSTLYLLSFQAVVISIDLEIVSFLTDVDLVSQMFGKMNMELSKLTRKKIFISKCLTTRIWNNDSSGSSSMSKNIRGFKCKKIETLASIYNQLADILDLINSTYCAAVMKIYFYYLIFEQIKGLQILNYSRFHLLQFLPLLGS